MGDLQPSRRLIGLSTKMYFDHHATHALVQNITAQLSRLDPAVLASIDVFLIPDFLSILNTTEHVAASGTSLRVGAQDCHWEDAGAFTGSVSPLALRRAGVGIVEIGHAERRRAGETDAEVAAKARAVVRNDMTPLVCIGEAERSGVAAALAACRAQIEPVVEGVPAEAELVFAYEPVWAIGASEPASAEYVKGVVRGIKGLACLQGRRGGTRVIYGGSAGAGLFAKLHEGAEGVDGLFLGRFGHDPEVFAKTLLEVAQAS